MFQKKKSLFRFASVCTTIQRGWKTRTWTMWSIHMRWKIPHKTKFRGTFNFDQGNLALDTSFNKIHRPYEQCVTRPKNLTRPVPGLFSVPNFLRDRFRDFFRYQILSETGSETFFGTKFFRDRFRDFFRYQIFPRPIPGLFPVPIFFRDRYRYHPKNTKVPGTGRDRYRDPNRHQNL